MRFVLGLVLFGVAAWFAWKAKQRWDYLNAKDLPPDPTLHPSLAIMADVAPSLYSLFLMVAAGGVILAFFASGAQRYLSLFDLAGFLAMIAAYGVWLNLRARRRT